MVDYTDCVNGSFSYLLSSDDLLTREWPEPVWAIPGILPAGLSILAGPPKVGKSWLGLQLALAVASGGITLGVQVEQGPILYLALEDPPRRLHERMKKQSWPQGLDANFITSGDFRTNIGDLSKGGSTKLAQLIKELKSRLIVIDTFSRAFSGDQDDVALMTKALTPIQEIAHENNSSVLLIDHHRKHTNEGQDPISDILGSTAKGALADTVMGLYQERGKPGARMIVTGREVEYKVIEIAMDWTTGMWQLKNNDSILPPEQRRVLNALLEVGEASTSDLADYLEINRGSIHKHCIELEKKGLVKKLSNYQWKAIGSQATGQPGQPI